MLSKASLWDNAEGKELFREVKSYASRQRANLSNDKRMPRYEINRKYVLSSYVVIGDTISTKTTNVNCLKKKLSTGGWQTRCYPVTKWRIWPRLLQISNLVHQINHVLCHIPDSTENNDLPGRALL